MTLYKWSQTAASNANADSTINFAEGQAPSSLNDSSRGVMAAVAKYRDDMAGSITTGGTSTAYTVTSNQVFDTLAHLNNQIIAFVPHTTNGATVTLNVDSLGAKPLRQAPSVEIPAGVLVAGTPYAATYNNSNGEFILAGFYGNPYAIPIGGFMPYVASNAAPNASFAYPCGQAISRTTYATLFGLCGTTYGTGDGSTTFNIPDIRGRSIFGLDGMGGYATQSRVTAGGSGIAGATNGATGGGETHTLTAAESAALTYALSTTGTASDHTHGIGVGSGTGPAGGAPAAPGASRAGTYSSDGSGPVSITATTTMTSTNAGGGAHNNMPPAIMLPIVMRII